MSDEEVPMQQVEAAARPEEGRDDEQRPREGQNRENEEEREAPADGIRMNGSESNDTEEINREAAVSVVREAEENNAPDGGAAAQVDNARTGRDTQNHDADMRERESVEPERQTNNNETGNQRSGETNQGQEQGQRQEQERRQEQGEENRGLQTTEIIPNE